MTLWAIAHKAPLSVEFFRQEYRSGFPFPFPADLPDRGIRPGSPTLQADSFLCEPPGKPNKCLVHVNSLLGTQEDCLLY